jgi:hypothetical protein
MRIKQTVIVNKEFKKVVVGVNSYKLDESISLFECIEGLLITHLNANNLTHLEVANDAMKEDGIIDYLATYNRKEELSEIPICNGAKVLNAIESKDFDDATFVLADNGRELVVWRAYLNGRNGAYYEVENGAYFSYADQAEALLNLLSRAGYQWTGSNNYCLDVN